jgi:eukaryotic-like serine/threonine-protein kinase
MDGKDHSIDAATWSRVSPLLDAALDLPPAERAGWLATLPPQHTDLKALLRELLDRAAAGETNTLLKALPAMDTRDDAAATDALARRHAAGDVVGPYRLVQPIGVGGMAEVWLAERTDGLMQQRSVALKLPFGPYQGDLAARFAREREILAALDHPHIARLYDAGVAADGQPYLALEHIDGQRIDRWCEQRQLGVAERLRLFLQAAHAVSQAHAQLIVHRDIKPSNLLVDATGQVKLLDFGIARLLIDAGDVPAGDVTQQGTRALTPDYAAPEQISGAPVGTRADVYALGVLLFELLTGKRPYRLTRDTRAALEEAILAAEVPRPSDVPADPALRRALRGDLDTIVLKALKKPLGERYASVDAFAEDIERHLGSRPVLARPDSASYRLRKFVVRNRLAVATASALLLTVLGGAGAALWQARVAIVERQRAEVVKNFVAAIFREASPHKGIGTKDLTAVDLLKQADQRLETALAGQTSARIELANVIGESLLALGDTAAAELVIARTVENAAQALSPTSEHAVRAMLLQSQVHRLRGRPQQARDDLDRLLPILRERVDRGETAAIDLVTALAHRTLTALNMGAYAEGERFAREGSVLAESRLEERDPQRVGSALLLSQALRFAKKVDLAVESGERAYRLAIDIHGGATPHLRVIEARGVYARALADAGDLVRGTAMIEASATEMRALLGPKDLQAAILVQNLVDYRIDLGEIELAEANAAEALAIIGENLAHDSMGYALTLHTRAAARLARRDAQSALAEATRAADVLDRVAGVKHDRALAAHTSMAMALMHDGRLDDASREIEAVALRAAVLDPSHALVARVTLARGTIARLRGDAAHAMVYLRPLIDSTQPAPKWQRERMRAWAQIGFVQLDRGAPTEAILSFERSLKEFERLESRVSPERADALAGLGRAHLAHGEPAKALPPLQQAEQFWRAFDPASPSAAVVGEWLARARAARRG